MENSCNFVALHPLYFDFLFAFKAQASKIFKEILEDNIDHVALTQIENHRMLTLSSTPSLEFNLFKSGLWHFDRSYDPSWYALHTHALWQQLYNPNHHDALSYLKQIKPAFAEGITLSIPTPHQALLYSFATKTQSTLEHFVCPKTLRLLGDHCYQQLQPLFEHCQSINEL